MLRFHCESLSATVTKPAGYPRSTPAVTTPPQPSTSPLPVGFSWQSAAPIALFVIANRLAGLRWAVVVATLWSVKIIVDRRRQGLPLGRFMPLLTAAVLIRGAIGAVTGSETVYFGIGIATKYVAAAVLAGSVAIARPLAALAAPYVLAMPVAMRDHRVFRSTMSIVTLIAALYYAASATVDIWLFRRSSVEGFVIWRFLANWPLSAVAIIAALATMQLRLTQIPGVESLTSLLEAKMQTYGLAPGNPQAGNDSP